MPDFIEWVLQLTQVDLLAASLLLLGIVVLGGMPLKDSTRNKIRRAIPRPIGIVLVVLVGAFGVIVLLRLAAG